MLRQKGAKKEKVMKTLNVNIDGFNYTIDRTKPKNNDWVVDCMITKNEVRRHEVDEELGEFSQGKVFRIISTNNPNIKI